VGVTYALTKRAAMLSLMFKKSEKKCPNTVTYLLSLEEEEDICKACVNFMNRIPTLI
jgi:hypothetical protein